MRPVELVVGNSCLGLLPSHGGVVTHWRVDGWDVLRPVVSDSNDPRDFAGFPLVPFSGRISNGRFKFDGRDIQLAANFPPEPHAIHGQGWQSAWSLSSIDDASATLALTHDGSDWPWAYKAEQVFEPAQDRLKVTLRLTNTSDLPMPAGLGWHPYFRLGDALIEADVTSVWAASDGSIPDKTEALSPETDVRSARPVSGLDLDNAFSAAGGSVCLHWPADRKSVRMTSDPAFQTLIVYTPAGEPYFCVEPVSHAPNAVNSSLGAEVTGLRTLSPGETLEGSIVLRVDAL